MYVNKRQVSDKRFKLYRVGKPGLQIIACWRARYYSFNVKLPRGPIYIDFIQFFKGPGNNFKLTSAKLSSVDCM